MKSSIVFVRHKDTLLITAYSLYSLAASFSFLLYFFNTTQSIMGSIGGLVVSFTLAKLLSTQLHDRTHQTIHILQVACFLVLPFIDVFQISLFQIRFSLEAILFYALSIRLITDLSKFREFH